MGTSERLTLCATKLFDIRSKLLEENSCHQAEGDILLAACSLKTLKVLHKGEKKVIGEHYECQKITHEQITHCPPSLSFTPFLPFPGKSEKEKLQSQYGTKS